MTIDEAIEGLKSYNSTTFETHYPLFSEALQLGIEALEEVKRNRICPPNGIVALLFGETEEVK